MEFPTTQVRVPEPALVNPGGTSSTRGKIAYWKPWMAKCLGMELKVYRLEVYEIIWHRQPYQQPH